MKQFSAKSIEASHLRRKKYELVRRHNLPEDLLGGSLCRVRRRCGKPNCHCVRGDGHPGSSVTFSHHGRRRVERIPEEWVADIEQAVLATQSYLDALKEVMAINLALLSLTRSQRRSKKSTFRRKSGQKATRKAKKRSPFESIDRS